MVKCLMFVILMVNSTSQSCNKNCQNTPWIASFLDVSLEDGLLKCFTCPETEAGSLVVDIVLFTFTFIAY